MRRIRDRLSDERGIAVVVALLVSMVVVTLGITSVTLAIHNSEQSNYDRRRVQSIAAAEAGVNWYFTHLQSVPAAQYSCSKNDVLPTSPSSQFEAVVTFYDVSGTPLPCAAGSVLGAVGSPTHALIHSEGRSTTNATPTRTMEAYVELSTVGAGEFGGVSIYVNSSLTLPSNVKVFGRTGNDGNVYSNGNVVLKGNDIISGDVTANGSVTLDNVAQVKRHVVASGAISLRSSTQILGNATSSTSSITVQQSKLAIVGDARAGTTITAGGGTIGGVRIPSSPTPFPSKPFPAFPWDPSAWIGNGYTVSTFADCASAKTFIAGLAGGKNVVRIEADCDLNYSDDPPVLTGDLAIVSDGSLTMGNNTTWASDGNLRNLYLVFGHDNDGGLCNITFGNNATIDPGYLTFFHTPCTVNMGSSAVILEGQIISGTLILKSGTGMTYRPLPIPGLAGGTAAEDIVYIREVVTT
ncbi:MAG TPA: hypothetical protein VG602_07185 [Actinomycetota bacterium]|nr:hypothetical protein [Actinomycetota bacterium]